MAAAGGFASVALIAVIGAWQLELFGPRTLPPMVMASVQLPEAELRFRGGAKKVTKPAQGNNSTKIFENSSQTILGDYKKLALIAGPTPQLIEKRVSRTLSPPRDTCAELIRTTHFKFKIRF